MIIMHTAEPRVTKVSFGRFYCQNQAHKVILSLPSTPIVARIRPTGSYSDLLVTQQQPELGPQSHTRFSQHPFLPSFLIFLKKGACGTTEINFQCHVYQKATTLSKYLACSGCCFQNFLKETKFRKVHCGHHRENTSFQQLFGSQILAKTVKGRQKNSFFFVKDTYLKKMEKPAVSYSTASG